MKVRSMRGVRGRVRRPWLVTALGCAAITLAAPAHAAEPTKDQCIDANETSQALRKSEKLHDAEQRLLVCVSASCPGPVRDDCAQRLTELRAVTPTLVFVVKDDADQDLSVVHVTIDGQTLTDKLDGTAIAVDPGPHTFTFETPGRKKEERSLVVREGEKDRHERVVLVTSSPADATVVPVSTPVPESTSPAAPSPARDGSTQRIAGITVGSVGVVGIVVGSIFGLVAKSKYNTALTECGNKPNTCTPQGVSDGSSAHSEAAVSTVAFIAGVALAGGGAILYFTAPKGVTVAPTVGFQSAGIAVAGPW